MKITLTYYTVTSQWNPRSAIHPSNSKGRLQRYIIISKLTLWDSVNIEIMGIPPDINFQNTQSSRNNCEEENWVKVVAEITHRNVVINGKIMQPPIWAVTRGGGEP